MTSVQAYRHEDRTREIAGRTNRFARPRVRPGHVRGGFNTIATRAVARAVDGGADWIIGADTAGVF